MLCKPASSFYASVVMATLLFIPISSLVAAETEQEKSTGQTDFAAQDAREREAALAFAKSRGLDLTNAVESKTGVWSLTIDEGQGPLAALDNTVTAHCTGWLADGTKFWSSHDGQNKPMVNGVGGFVKGFTEGLQTMKSGGKSLFIFPGRLGYGPSGNPRAKIPPNATLVFEVELISIR